MFSMMEAARLEALHLADDPVSGLKAVIAIHSTRLGPALGGCRYLAYPDEQSAIRDALREAKTEDVAAVKCFLMHYLHEHIADGIDVHGIADL